MSDTLRWVESDIPLGDLLDTTDISNPKSFGQILRSIFFNIAPASSEAVYRGTKARSAFYLGVKSDAQIYLGAKSLF
jgi:hypothetical protein